MKNYHISLLVLGMLPIIAFSQSSIEYTKTGFAKLKLKDYSNAIPFFDSAIVLAPNIAKNYYYRGFCKNRIMDYRGALADYDKVILLDSLFNDIYFSRGTVRWRLKDFKGAIVDLN